MQTKLNWSIVFSVFLLTGCPDLVRSFSVKSGQDATVASPSNSSPTPAARSVERYSKDFGQNADLLITVDRSASPIIAPADLADQKLVIEGRALNFPYRKVMIVRVEARPELAGISVERLVNGAATVKFDLSPDDPQNGSLRVIARDLAACETRLANGAASCSEIASELTSFEQTQVFSWNLNVHKVQELPSLTQSRLASGPPSLKILASRLPRAGNLFAEAHAKAQRFVTEQSFLGGVTVKLVSFDSFWGQLSSERGQYPGYGYSGLVSGQLYAGGGSEAKSTSDASYYRGFEQVVTIGSAYQYELPNNDPYDRGRFDKMDAASSGSTQSWQVH